MTITKVVKIKREKNSEWERALELNFDVFSIKKIYDENGLEISKYYDIEYLNNKSTRVCRFL